MKLISLPSLSIPMGRLRETSCLIRFDERMLMSISFSMHFAAYVASLVDFLPEYVPTAFISPMVPMDIRSSWHAPGPAYFFAI